ncbi:MAG: SGNH/GDSL hydrolase family protein [Elusimicrobia bacterium]|nr:SGNH/GDSL hydrolase family protein [Elusimicrobiota bacterium]
MKTRARPVFFILVPLAAAAAGLWLALLTGEAYCRLRGLCALQSFRSPDYPSNSLFIPSDFLPFDLAPNLPGFTNSLGMRDKERVIKKAPGVFRIITLGDSITMYGHYTDFLEDILAHRLGLKAEVWNCSIGGHGIADYYHNLERRVIHYHPDMILIGFCLNDLQLTPVIFRGVDGKMHCYRPMRLLKGHLDNWLYCRSSLYRLFLTGLEARRQRKAELYPDEVGRFYLHAIQELCRKHKLPLLTMIFPYFRFHSEEVPEYQTLKRVVAGSGADCIDLHEVFPRAERLRYLPPKAADDIHPNDAAHRIVAEVLARHLLKSGLLPAPDPGPTAAGTPSR